MRWTALFLFFALPAQATDMGESLYFNGLHGINMTLPPATAAGQILFETRSFSDNVLYDEFDALIFHGEFLSGSSRDWDNIRFTAVVPGPDGGDDIVFPLPGQPDSGGYQVQPEGRFWGTVLFPDYISGVPVKWRIESLAPTGPIRLVLFDSEAFIREDGEGGGGGRINFDGQDQERERKKEEEKDALIKRTEWVPKDFKPKEAYEAHKPNRITFHHTAGKQTATKEESIRELRSILKMQTDPPEKGGRGWNDIAYHYFVDKAGNLFEGRPDGVIGAHAGSKKLNRNNVGVCLMGYFHPPKNHKAPETQGGRLVKLFDALVVKFIKNKMTKTDIYAHRDLKATDCPGDWAYKAFSVAKPDSSDKK